jgi:hypothetical protein
VSPFSWFVAKYPPQEQKRYFEANGHSASQEITHRLRKPEVTHAPCQQDPFLFPAVSRSKAIVIVRKPFTRCMLIRPQLCVSAPAEEHAALYSEGLGFKPLCLFCGYHQSFQSNTGIITLEYATATLFHFLYK